VLRSRRERRRHHRAAEKVYEIAPSHCMPNPQGRANRGFQFSQLDQKSATNGIGCWFNLPCENSKLPKSAMGQSLPKRDVRVTSVDPSISDMTLRRSERCGGPRTDSDRCLRHFRPVAKSRSQLGHRAMFALKLGPPPMAPSCHISSLGYVSSMAGLSCSPSWVTEARLAHASRRVAALGALNMMA
jgi:hypothetical protein